MRTALIAALILVPLIVNAQETPTDVPAVAPAVQEATTMVSIPEAEYQALKAQVQYLTQKRSQLLWDNEQLAAEVSVWKQRLSRVLRCRTIQEAIEELQAVMQEGKQ